MLAPTDYEITEAENGEEALAAIAKQRPDLILIDIQLPIDQDLRKRQPVLDLAGAGIPRSPGLFARLSAAEEVLKKTRQ
jgi:CheY-like chemotaxis protein